MAFDVLRTYHAVNARIDDKGLVTKRIRWKPCKSGAKAFPGWHSYGSPVWEPHPEDWIKGPGIESGPLIYSNGRGYVPPGVEFHGNQEWFEAGIPKKEIDALTPDSPQGTCWPPVEAIESMGKPVEYVSSDCSCDFDFDMIRFNFSGKTGGFTAWPDFLDVPINLGTPCGYSGEVTNIDGDSLGILTVSYVDGDPGTWTIVVGASFLLTAPITFHDPDGVYEDTTIVGDHVAIVFEGTCDENPIPGNVGTVSTLLGDSITLSTEIP